jgi:predicted ABC-type exoprotein transport system permease subunit
MWTALMFLYLVLAVVALGAGVFGYSQHLTGGSPWALWIIPVCALIAVLIPILSRAGQTLAREQMGLLSGVLERALPSARP